MFLFVLLAKNVFLRVSRLTDTHYTEYTKIINLHTKISSNELKGVGITLLKYFFPVETPNKL